MAVATASFTFSGEIAIKGPFLSTEDYQSRRQCFEATMRGPEVQAALLKLLAWTGATSFKIEKCVAFGFTTSLLDD